MTRRERRRPPAFRLLLLPLAVILTGVALPKHPPAPVKRPDRASEARDKTEPGNAASEQPLPETKVPVPTPAPAPVPTKPPAAAKPAGKPSDESGEPSDDTENPADSTEQPADNSEEPTRPKPAPEPVPGIHEDLSALSSCYTELDRLGVVYEKEKTINGPGKCGIEAPVSVTKILPDISLKPANEMRCATALALARWTKRVVRPAAEELGSHVHLTGLAQGSAYVCRHRDSIETRKISEHAFGNAVDIVTFDFDGHTPLSIAPRRRTGKIEESFQRAVIGGACLYFTTVLGPRADSFHHDNLHLDVIERGHGFRLCQ